MQWLGRSLSLLLIVFLSSCLEGEVRGAKKQIEIPATDPVGPTVEIERDKEPYICAVDVSGFIYLGINHSLVEYDLFKNQVVGVLQENRQEPIDALLFLGFENELTAFSQSTYESFLLPKLKVDQVEKKETMDRWEFDFTPIDAITTLSDSIALVFSGHEMLEYTLGTKHTQAIELPQSLIDIPVDAAFRVLEKIYVLSGDRYYELRLDDYVLLNEGAILDLLPGLSDHYDPSSDLITAAEFIDSEHCEDASN